VSFPCPRGKQSKQSKQTKHKLSTHTNAHRIREGASPIERNRRGEGGGEVVRNEEEEDLEAVGVKRCLPEVAIDGRAQEEQLHAQGLFMLGV
jgi:hypothetical protein